MPEESDEERIGKPEKHLETEFSRFKPYLDYLKLEMSIMGILSTFAIAAVALALREVFSKDLSESVSTALWCGGVGWFIVFGTVLLLLAAILFYEQRSTLAWHSGRIIFALAHGDWVEARGTIDEANSWTTWRWYFWGWHAALWGLFEFLAALVGIFAGSVPFAIQFSALIVVAGVISQYLFMCRREREGEGVEWSKSYQWK